MVGPHLLMSPAPSSAQSFAGKVALVVGGVNGLGRSIASAYARRGATVVIADLRAADGARTLHALGLEDRGLALEIDIGNVASIRQGYSRISERFGRLDILVNCAAICLVDPLIELSEERWNAVFSVNARGAFFCMQEAARLMLPRKWGRILTISTPASRMGFPLFATYGASKAAVDSLVKSAALAWSPDITVNTIVPGRMTGGMVDRLEIDLGKVTGRTLDELAADRTKGLPMQRRVDPDEVAAAAVWLASDEARYVTGERFNFTGGMELQ